MGGANHVIPHEPTVIGRHNTSHKLIINKKENLEDILRTLKSSARESVPQIGRGENPKESGRGLAFLCDPFHW